jgi:chorismate dehydratase
MQKISISVVAYANSLPFVYGLLHTKFSDKIDVQIDIPSICADKLINNSVDISLVPAAELLRLNNCEIVSDLCIGANNFVKTVILASDCPLNEIEEIYLDYQSRTSVVLVKVLAKHYWNIKPKWIAAKPGYETNVIKGKTGAVIIGDRAFSAKANHIADLSHEWNNFTHKPFVFAVWLTQKNLPQELINEFNQALLYGVEHARDAVKVYNKTPLNDYEIYDYLQKNINYQFDNEKNKALKLFLKYASELNK